MKSAKTKPARSRKGVPARRQLNPRQRTFQAEYLKDKNATQAAIRAGYSRKTAASIGQRLLKNVEIATWIKQELAKIEGDAIDSAGLTRAMVLTRLRQLVNYDEADAFDPETGQLLPIHEIPADTRAAITGIEFRDDAAGARSSSSMGNGDAKPGRNGSEAVVRSRLTKIRFADRRGAVELAMRHLNLLGDEGNPNAAAGGGIVRLPSKAKTAADWRERVNELIERATGKTRE